MNDLINGLKELWSPGDSAPQFKFGVGKAIMVALVIFVCLQFLGGLVNLPALFWDERFYHISLPLSFAVGGALAIFVLLPMVNANWASIKEHIFKPVAPSLILISIIFFASVLPFAEFLTSLVPTDNGGILEEVYNQFAGAMDMMTNYTVAGFITVCIMAPIFEEILFRGILLRGMLQNGMSPAIAIVISAFLFGFVHMNPWQFLGAGTLGIALGYVYYRTKSLWLVMLLHALNNSISYILMMKEGTMDQDVSDTGNFVGIGLSLLICIGLGTLIYNSTQNTSRWT